MARYVMGIDFGTLSARAIVVNVENGDIPGQGMFIYPHGVMDERLPNGHPLGIDWAVQHPQDYLDAIKEVVTGALQDAKITADDVVALGIDFTSCTMIAADQEGTPLCLTERFEDHPHAYAILWKHHAAQPQADRMTELGAKMGEPWLAIRGGKVSPECLFPKALQMLEEDPAVYKAAYRYLEAGDWIVWRLTGRIARNACMAGYRAMWDGQYPSRAFFEALNPAFASIIEDLIPDPVVPLGTRAGTITKEGAALCGLNPGTPVSVAATDAHMGMPASGVVKPGEMLGIIGTSACFMLLGNHFTVVPGICAVVKDGLLPGYYGYEAGQCCAGDHFDWYTRQIAPAAYHQEAKDRGIGLHALLTEKAGRLRPGESGLLALDWWNGNRSILIDGDLTGVLLGMTLRTKPEEIYRALLEGTAFGVRAIIENYRANGIPVTAFHATGGIAKKNALMMQIYADITGLPVQVAAIELGSAMGAALFAAAAAGREHGGYDSVYDAIQAIVPPPVATYHPIPAHQAVYDKLYAQYIAIHDRFGRDPDSPIKRLKQIKQKASISSEGKATP